MLKISFRLCHKSLRLLKVHYSCMSTSVQPNEQMYQYFRTNESDPSKQSYEHEGQFYTLKPDIATKLFLLGGFDKEQQLALKTFRETAIMIRKPALEIMGYLKKTDFSKPVNRYILCKIHYLIKQTKIVFFLRWICWNWKNIHIKSSCSLWF